MREVFDQWKGVGLFLILAILAAVLLSSIAGDKPQVWRDEIVEGNSVVTMKNVENGKIYSFDIRFNAIGELSRIDLVGGESWTPSFGTTDSWFQYWNPVIGIKFETRFYHNTVELRHTDDWVIVERKKQ